MTPTSPWAAKVDGLLADGRWHSIDEIVGFAASTVPPGVAARRGERERLAVGGPADRVRGNDGTAIATARRKYVKEAVRARLHAGRYEQRGVGPTREIRKVTP